jgi:hypothetical protein
MAPVPVHRPLPMPMSLLSDPSAVIYRGSKDFRTRADILIPRTAVLIGDAAAAVVFVAIERTELLKHLSVAIERLQVAQCG